jgi:hypothetical protein
VHAGGIVRIATVRVSAIEEEAIPMSGFRTVLAVLLFGMVFPSAHAQQPSPGAPDATVFASRCFQCHSASIWIDHRQDRRAWEGVLYRMVGRGALWTEAEIDNMATYLTSAYGPASGNPSRLEGKQQ